MINFTMAKPKDNKAKLSQNLSSFLNKQSYVQSQCISITISIPVLVHWKVKFGRQSIKIFWCFIISLTIFKMLVMTRNDAREGKGQQVGGCTGGWERGRWGSCKSMTLIVYPCAHLVFYHHHLSSSSIISICHYLSLSSSVTFDGWPMSMQWQKRGAGHKQWHPPLPPHGAMRLANQYLATIGVIVIIPVPPPSLPGVKTVPEPEPW